MKNFLKKHFYTIPEVYLKLEEDIEVSVFDILRMMIISVLLFTSMVVFMGLILWFVSWNFSDYPSLIRGTLVLIFLFFFILKKWWKSKD